VKKASLRSLPVDLDELAFALQSQLDDYSYYFDLETGAIHFLPEGIAGTEAAAEEELLIQFAFADTSEIDAAMEVAAHPERFLEIYPMPNYEAFQDMVDFTYLVQDPQLRSQLKGSLSRRRPFRSFKDVLLNDPEERERWFAFQKERMQQEAIDWLAGHGIQPE